METPRPITSDSIISNNLSNNNLNNTKNDISYIIRSHFSPPQDSLFLKQITYRFF